MYAYVNLCVHVNNANCDLIIMYGTFHMEAIVCVFKMDVCEENLTVCEENFSLT